MHLLTSKGSLRIAIALVLGSLISCGNTPDPEDLRHLTGYWEIEQVTFPNGETRDFPPSTTVDYYFLEGEEGFLKKVQPELNGRFRVNDDKITLRIVSRDKLVILQFAGKEDSWEEVLEVLTSDRLETSHDNGLRYRYRRYTPIIITE